MENSSSPRSSRLLLPFLDVYGLHYSWSAIGVSALYIFLSGTGATYGIGAYAGDWESEVGISRTALSLCWSGGLVLTAATVPFAGPFIDKCGIRKLSFGLIIPSFVGLLWLSTVDDLATLLFALFIVRLSTVLLILVSSTLVNYWWVASKKGQAVSITNCFGNLCLTWPSLIALLSNSLGGWRSAMRVESFIVLGLSVLAAFLTLDKPEQYGRLPDARPSQKSAKVASASESSERLLDGADQENSENSNEEENLSDSAEIPAALIETNWHWRDAVKTRLFYSFNLSLLTTGLLWAGFSFHFKTIIQESGVEETMNIAVSDMIYLPIALVVILTMIPVGKIFDRLANRCRAMIISHVACALALICILSLPDVAASGSSGLCYFLVLCYSVCYGLMNSVQTIANVVVCSYAFGRFHNGTIFALNSVINQSSMALGPILFGLSRDFTGSYQPVLVFLLGLSIVVGGYLAITPIPDPKMRTHNYQTTTEQQQDIELPELETQ